MKVKILTDQEVVKYIEEYYKYNYGTNYDENSLQSSILGAKAIITEMKRRKITM